VFSLRNPRSFALESPLLTVCETEPDETPNCAFEILKINVEEKRQINVLLLKKDKFFMMIEFELCHKLSLIKPAENTQLGKRYISLGE
jgi:hypothetical protein